MLSNKVKLSFVLFAVPCIGLGIGVGALIGGSHPSEVAAPVPTPTVTKMTNVYQTPSSCLDYIDYSSTAFGYASDSAGILDTMVTAGIDRDVTAMASSSSALKAKTQSIKDITPRVQAARDSCKASAK